LRCYDILTHIPSDRLQFDPEQFVDSLLGIGVAGGKSASEGAKLAARLKELQKERDARSKALMKAGSAEPSLAGLKKPVASTASVEAPASKITGVTPITSAGSRPAATKPGKSKKNSSKKKGKR
jgi:hypothetical protein